MIYLGATNYPTTSLPITGKNLSLLQFQCLFNNFQSVMTVGSLTIQEDYATNIFLLRWPGRRRANTA